jgi:hypothetical protein
MRACTRTVFAILLGLWAAGAAGAEPAAETPWRFVATGDSRGSDADHSINTYILAEMARAIAAEKPEVVLFSGDLALGPGTVAKFEAWTNVMAPVYQAGARVYPVRGNHDLGDEEAWKTVFGASIPDNGPRGQKDFAYAASNRNALFIGLDTCSSVDPKWVDQLLATNRLPHVFLYGHVTAFHVGHMDSLDNDVKERDALLNSLKKAGGRVYFCGHDHFYHHLRIDDGDGNPDTDLHQLIAGTAGAPLRQESFRDGERGAWVPKEEHSESEYGYVLVEIAGPKVTLTWKHRIAPDAYRKAEEFSYTVKPSERNP